MLLLLNLFIITVSIAEAVFAPKRFYHYEKYTKLDTLRLPNDTKPLAYDIYLETNIHKGVFDFKGVVNITLEAVENTDEITLHMDDLKEVRIQLTEKESEQELNGLTYNYDKEHQRMTIFSEPDPFELKKGNHYVLAISYRGKQDRAANGFYRSYYKDRDGNVVWLATTHFEPTYARKAFPCYDEPALKANFTVTIAHGSNYSALSNMPLDGEPVDIGDDMIVSKFKTTPSISTYNIAFVVANYKTIEDTYDGVTHRIHSPLAAENNGEYALINSIAILTALEEYFSIKYPFEKIDHITVPDHDAIAMENWGLIIYRFGNLLPYSKNSEMDNAKIVNVIAHELSHQWFGNLVTNEWWSLAWLNEALATYYGLKTLNAIKPSWKAWNYYFINLVGFVSLGDYDSQPLTHYVESRDDLNERFNPSTYYKGAHMLYMLEHALTENTMRKGISNYLKKYQHSTADEEDLFEELQAAATADNIPLFSEIGTIKKILTPWTHQRKYPIVIATRDYESGSVHLRQLSYDVYLDDAKVQKYWYIPVAMATESEPNFEYTRPDFIFPNTENFTLNPSEINRTLQENDWLILNKDQIGMFRLNYDKRNWELIIKALKENPKSISPMTKAQLIRDCVFFSSHKKVSSSILVSLLSYLKVEDDIEPWLEAIPELLFYIMFVKADEEVHYVKYFIDDIIEHGFKNAFDNLNETNLLLEYFRQSLLELACGAGSNVCEKFVKENIDNIMTNGPMEPELKRIVYEEICKTATEEEKKVLEGLPKLDPDRPEYESPAENLFSGTCKL